MAKNRSLLTLLLALVAALPAFAGQQIVRPNPSYSIAGPSTGISSDVNYSTANPQNANLSGLTLRVHYDSTQVTFQGLTNMLQTGLVSVGTPQADSSDFDADPYTDQFVTVTWSDGGSQWPGSEPQRLFTVNVTMKPTFAVTTHVRFSAAATAPGYGLADATWTIWAQNYTPADVQNDRRTDLFWRANPDELWFMNGVYAQQIVQTANATYDFQIVGIGDFYQSSPGTRDGADVVWRDHLTGQVAYWNNYQGGGTFSQQFFAGTPADVQWVPAGSGDVDGDRIDDLVWFYPADSTVGYWRHGLVDDKQTFSNVPAILPANWRPVAIADFDGNGTADVFLRNTSTGENSLWLTGSNGTIIAALAVQPVVAPWEFRRAADVDDDGRADLLWMNPSTGQTSIWLMNRDRIRAALVAPFVPSPWQLVTSGDFDGDGQADMLWRNPNTGETAYWIAFNLDHYTALLAGLRVYDTSYYPRNP